MAISKKLPTNPYAILDPDDRWYPGQQQLVDTYRLIPPLVHKIRKKVKEWRENKYKGASETSTSLLRWWFQTEHHIDGTTAQFRYYFAQREAVETVVYLYEVAGVKDKFDLMRYDSSGVVSHGMFDENWKRFVLKMATGTGKTKVMSLLIAWAYFHKHYEPQSELAKNFLVVAPNIIVLDRLRSDIEGLKIFYQDPILPENGFEEKDWRNDFNLTVHIQDEVRITSTTGNLFLTNIHRVYTGEVTEPSADDDNTTSYFLGKKPTGGTTDTKTDLGDIVREVDELVIFNDEAHHIHHEKLEWFKSIQDIHNRLVQKNSFLSLQIDVTATPKNENGAIFVQTVCDYPLVEAIYHNILKQPVIPDSTSQSKLQEKPSAIFSEKYSEYLNLGVEEWCKAYKECEKAGKKAVLFVMTDDTTNCDDVAEYLQKNYAELENAVLVIHTNRSGEISEAKTGRALKELQELRKQASEIDKLDNPYKAVVSVMMLKEGWDVRNVTTIVGLRSYSSKSKILPEQTLGRGLRKMFPEQEDVPETLSVIGTDKFIEFVESIKVEGVELERVEMGTGTTAKTPIIIEVDKDNRAKDIDALDIEIPVLTPRIYREYKDLADLNPKLFNHEKVALKTFSNKQKKEIVFIHYENNEVSHKTELNLSRPPDSSAIIGYYSRTIMKELRLVSDYDIIYEKVKDFIKNHLFDSTVDIEDTNVLRNLSETTATRTIIETFKEQINKLTVRDKGSPEIKNYIKLRNVRPFVVKQQDSLEPEKSIFNRIVGDSHFELEFCRFLEDCDDVTKYAKNNFAINFKLDYTNADGEISNYFPDFIVQTSNGKTYIVETKGREDLDVPHKMKRLKQWCDDINRLKGKAQFDFVYVPQEDFDKYHPGSFQEIADNFTEYK